VHVLILCCGFVGAWLLFAGPLFQAVLELRSEEIEFDRLRELGTTVPAPPAPSSWWWILPPVAWMKHRRRRELHQRLMVVAMTES
jgi:hypothetical protein